MTGNGHHTSSNHAIAPITFPYSILPKQEMYIKGNLFYSPYLGKAYQSLSFLLPYPGKAYHRLSFLFPIFKKRISKVIISISPLHEKHTKGYYFYSPIQENHIKGGRFFSLYPLKERVLESAYF